MKKQEKNSKMRVTMKNLKMNRGLCPLNWER